jgi:hypothetical protein
MAMFWFHVDASNRSSTGPHARCTAYTLNPAFSAVRSSNSRTPCLAKNSIHERTVRA